LLASVSLWFAIVDDAISYILRVGNPSNILSSPSLRIWWLLSIHFLSALGRTVGSSCFLLSHYSVHIRTTAMVPVSCHPTIDSRSARRRLLLYCIFHSFTNVFLSPARYCSPILYTTLSFYATTPTQPRTPRSPRVLPLDVVLNPACFNLQHNLFIF